MHRYRLIATPITLLLLLGVLIFGAWWGYKQITAPLPGNEPTPCVTAPATELTPNKVAIRVFNGGYTTGLGGKVKDALEGAGFNVLSAGNTTERVKKTIIVAVSEKAPEALLVAPFFKDATIRPDPERTTGVVDVLVGSEYAGMNMEAPKVVAVPGGTACLPVIGAAKPTGTSTAVPSVLPSPAAPATTPAG